MVVPGGLNGAARVRNADHSLSPQSRPHLAALIFVGLMLSEPQLRRQDLRLRKQVATATTQGVSGGTSSVGRHKGNRPSRGSGDPPPGSRWHPDRGKGSHCPWFCPSTWWMVRGACQVLTIGHLCFTRDQGFCLGEGLLCFPQNGLSS